jgi:prephenate dehydrogenase
MMQKSDPIEFSIIGAGRFGYFWGKHLNKYYSTSFFDNDKERVKSRKNLKWDTLENCLKKKYIFLTIPIGKFEEFLKNNSHKIQSGSIVIDCASVKVAVMDWFAKYLPEDVFYIASHPLFGPDSARNKLRDHILMLMPGRIPYGDYRFLVQLFTKDLGLFVYHLTAEEHDELMAYNLNLVHHLGRALHDLEISKLSLMMSGLQKLNEIVSVVMNDTQELFLDFYKYNPRAEEIYQHWLKSLDKINALVKKKK